MNKIKRLFYYIRNYKFNSILIKNFIVIMLLIILPFSGITYIMYKNMNETVYEEISSINQNSLYKVRDVIDNLFDDIDEMAVFFSEEPKVKNFLISKQYVPLISSQYKNLYNLFDMYTFVYDYVDSIYVYSGINKRTISSDNDLDITWQDKYISNEKGTPDIVIRKKRDIYPYLITLIRPIYQTYYTNELGAVIINIDMEELGKLIKKNNTSGSENIIIVDKNDQIIFTQNSEFFLRKINEIDIYNEINYKHNTGDSSNILNIKEKKYAVSIASSNKHDWTYISVQPLMHYDEKQQDIIHYVFFVLGICILIAFFVAVIISIRAFNPVISILSLFENPEKLNMLNDNNTKQKNDEIKLIAENIMKTIFSNRQLKEELETRLVMLNQAQTAALQAQINPHFLYNTLETIRWLVVELTQGENKPSNMISSLSKLLRLSLESKEQMITIEEEITHAKFYIEIMKVRYEDRLKVEWEIQEEILNNKIVKFVMQPLIENAIYHGIKPSEKNGVIKIIGKKSDDNIIIIVSDNGMGMRKEKMHKINQSLKNSNTLYIEHIGIHNVNQRIKLALGKEYGIKLVENDENGISVYIKIPIGLH